MQVKETKSQKFTRIFAVTAIAVILGVSGWMKSGGDFSNLF